MRIACRRRCAHAKRCGLARDESRFPPNRSRFEAAQTFQHQTQEEATAAATRRDSLIRLLSVASRESPVPDSMNSEAKCQFHPAKPLFSWHCSLFGIGLDNAFNFLNKHV